FCTTCGNVAQDLRGDPALFDKAERQSLFRFLRDWCRGEELLQEEHTRRQLVCIFLFYFILFYFNFYFYFILFYFIFILFYFYFIFIFIFILFLFFIFILILFYFILF